MNNIYHAIMIQFLNIQNLIRVMGLSWKTSQLLQKCILRPAQRLQLLYHLQLQLMHQRLRKLHQLLQLQRPRQQRLKSRQQQRQPHRLPPRLLPRPLSLLQPLLQRQQQPQHLLQQLNKKECQNYVLPIGA